MPSCNYFCNAAVLLVALLTRAPVAAAMRTLLSESQKDTTIEFPPESGPHPNDDSRPQYDSPSAFLEEMARQAERVDARLASEGVLATRSTSPANLSAPVVWVPGITSSALEARVVGPLPDFCNNTFGASEDGWFSIYVNARRGVNLPCLLYSLALQPPSYHGPDGDGCVRDADGLEIREVGFGEGRPVLNPEDPIKVGLYDKMISMFESLGLERGKSIRFATYDWRKYGDPCWEREWFPKLALLIEQTAIEAKHPAIIGCHSMGCPLLHVFLNTRSPEWKQHYVQELLAAAPAFGGATQILQNFIQGPSYAMMPLVASQIGRAAMASMPGFYTLSPSRGMEAWPEDLTIVATPWKNYTIASLYDGSFWDDVEGEEDDEAQGESHEEKAQAGAASLVSERNGNRQILNSQSSEDNGTVADDRSDWVLTEHSCVCQSPCESSLSNVPGFGTGLESVFRTVSPNYVKDFLAKPWCHTVGTCGNKHAYLSARFYDFRHWDFCGGEAKPIDAGLGFDFFPGVNNKPDPLYKRWTFGLFGSPGFYEQVKDAPVEDLKRHCLNDARCTGFDTDGWMQSGVHAPNETWMGIRKSRQGVLQGLYLKRAEVQSCQKSQTCEVPVGTTDNEAVCGSDGETYSSACHLQRAHCWNPSLELAYAGPCVTNYTTPQGCQCEGGCGALSWQVPFQKATGIWSLHLKGADILGNVAKFAGASFPPMNQRWCTTKGNCGHHTIKSYSHYWDLCVDEGGNKTEFGFEFFRAAYISGSVLRQPQPGTPVCVAALQIECGADPACGGFQTDGTLLTHEFRHRPELWFPDTDGTHGVYRKALEVVACQRNCTGEAKAPVCLIEHGKTLLAGKTFDSACAAANFKCLPSEQKAWSAKPGPCTRQASNGLHRFARRWLNRTADLGPPGVPTTCMYITDVATDFTWSFNDFLTKGITTNTSEGDGTVNAQSIEGPCRKWKHTQPEAVDLVPLELGGASHVSMLLSAAFWDRVRERVSTTADM